MRNNESLALEKESYSDYSSSIHVYTPLFNPKHESQFLEYLDPSSPSEKYAGKSSFFKRITFLDLLPHLKKLNKLYPRYTISDLPNPEKDYNVEKKLIDLDYHWINEQKKPNPDFSRAVYKTFLKEIILSFTLTFIENTARIFHAIYMGKILKVITSKNVGELFESQELISSAALLSIFVIISFITKNWSFYNSEASSAQARLAIIGLIYKKLNSVSTSSIREINIGKVSNLIGNDMNDIYNLKLIPNTILCPYMFGLGTCLMWNYFGPCCLVGLVSLIFIFFGQIWLSNMTAGPSRTMKTIADERIKYTHELIESIRLIKIYTWEKIFKKKILDLRQEEQKSIVKILYIDSLGRNLSNVSSFLNILLICICCVVFDETLSSEKVFVSMVIFNYLAAALNQSYLGRISLISFNTASKRIEEVFKVEEDILTTEEVSPFGKSMLKPIEPVVFSNFAAYWDKDSLTPCLHNITATFKPGFLTTVIGKIGSGKTTLLLSLLKKMPKTSGNLEASGKIAYVEQDPIIFAGTIRDNILFGKEWDEDLYQSVLEECMLKEDLEMFPNKDLTKIGEKGTNISGGQRTRLSLARALYSQSDIYLLDDPFSALDGKVARNIFNNILKGDLLENKIIILTTHHMYFARESDHVILMDQGRIEAQGTFQDLENLQINLLGIFSTESNEEKAKTLEIYQSKEEAKSPTDQNKPAIKKETQEEENLEVTLDTYKQYFKAKGSFIKLLSLALLFIIPEALKNYLMLLIGDWASQHDQLLIINQNTPINKLDNSFYVIVTSSIFLVIFITNYIKVFKGNEFVILINTELHRKMLEAIVRAKVLFFDTNPIGKILDRFSGDLGSLEAANQRCLFDFFEGTVIFLCLLITICIISPIVIILGFLAIYALYQMTKYFNHPMTLSARLNVITRSPLVSFASATIQGLMIIRVYRQGGRFIREFLELVYVNMKAYLFHAKVLRLLCLMLDFINQLLALSGVWTFVILMSYYDFKAGLLGLSFTYLLRIADQSSFVARQALFMDSCMQNTARILEYSKVESEELDHIPEIDNALESNDTRWPMKGEVVFNNVYLKYKKENEFVLKGVSFRISPGQKVALVGRTGAGKSSIIQALFRMAEIESGPDYADSYINIDGIDTKTMGLRLLRSGLSIIPQVPTIFKGTIRQNIDPFERHTGDQLWKVLEEVGLKDHISSLENKLDTDMTVEKSEFSSGQKQLLCLARTMLSRSKIVVLDEATSNIDIETDKFIQTKIMEKLKDCTIIAVAHRLITIANYDQIIVIDNGKIVEQGPPYSLLVNSIGDKTITRTDGIFAEMAMSTGDSMSATIFQVAMQKYSFSNERIKENLNQDLI